MIQEMHERLKKANERRNCRADEEIVSLRAALAAKDAEIAELKEQHAREIERIKKNHGCARQQGTTQYCREALDAHKEADALRAAIAAKDAEIERLQTAIGEWKVQAHGAGVRADNAERRETHLRSTLAAKNAEIERLREGLRSIYGELGYCIYGSPTDGKGQAKAMLRCYGTAEKALANAAPEPEPETCAWEDRGLDGWWPGCCDERDDGCSKWEYPAAPETCPGCGKRVEVRG